MRLLLGCTTVLLWATLDGRESENGGAAGEDELNMEQLNAMKRAMVTTLGRSEEELLDMQRYLFDRIDLNKDGVLAKDEVKQWMAELLIASNKKHAKAEVKLIDRDGDNKISWDEMMQAMREAEADADENGLKKRVELADVNKDGFLDNEEMCYLLSPGMRDELKELEAKEIMDIQDTNKDGKIDFEEFLAHEKKHHHEVEQEEMWSEFAQYDLDGDSKINLEELKEAFAEPRPALINEAVEEFFGNEETKSREEYLRNWPRYSKQSITDRGQLLRTPKDYPLNPPMPFNNVDILKEDMDSGFGSEDDEDDDEYEKDEL